MSRSLTWLKNSFAYWLAGMPGHSVSKCAVAFLSEIIGSGMKVDRGRVGYTFDAKGDVLTIMVALIAKERDDAPEEKTYRVTMDVASASITWELDKKNG